MANSQSDLGKTAIPDSLIQPSELSVLLNSDKINRPLVLQIGVEQLYDEGHIPGSEYVGMVSEKDGLMKLRNRIKKLPKNKFVVIYCGCCPWNVCPNVKPAYEEMKKQGFINVRQLYLPKNLNLDWLDNGYPVETKK